MTPAPSSASPITRSTPHRDGSLDVHRPSPLVKPFALLGALSLALGAQAWGRWIMSSDFKPAPRGADEASTARLVALRIFEFGSLAVALFFVWRFIIRPLLQDRTLGFDGLLVVAGFTCWWIDPLGNYFNGTVFYNANFINRGSWALKMPGWAAPNQNRLPEPLIGIGSTYIWWICGMAIGGSAVMRWVRRRHPDMTLLSLFAVCFVFFTCVDLVLEFLFIYLFQAWVYGGVIGSLSLFAGRWYQFPVYQPLLMGLMGVMLGGVRYCRDDRGNSIVERGIDGLRLGQRMRPFVSFLALCGYVHVGVLVLGNGVPYWYFALKADTFAPLPSYMRSGICGVGTDYACPGKHIPIPSRSSLHIGPEDPALPDSVRRVQGK